MLHVLSYILIFKALCYFRRLSTSGAEAYAPYGHWRTTPLYRFLRCN